MTPGRAPRGAFRKFLVLSLPSLLVSAIVVALIAEVWVRLSWSPRKGTPGFFVSDPARGQRLAPNYMGWFAGVPVHVNSLGLRDDREYSLEKGANTFRILVLGDSVTFGHGAISANTYPRLLERLLRDWRPDIDWQVWNAAVPGYNTSQELAQLLEIGPAYQPDLVVIGFYENDLIDNHIVRPPGAGTIATSRVLAFVQRHVYSFELYKKVVLQLASNVSGSRTFRRRLEHLETESALLAPIEQIESLPAQRLTPYERLTDEQIGRFTCRVADDPTLIAEMQREPGWDNWVRAVRELQELNRRGDYNVVFFLNVVPRPCPDGDFFWAGSARAVNNFLLKIMSDGTPAVSALEGFLHRRPSQMPAAAAHAIGNSNMTKAEVLFDFLRGQVLPGRLPDGATTSATPAPAR